MSCRVLWCVLISVCPDFCALAQTILDLDEVIVETENLASDIGCPVRITS
jgi:hypothetical protein